MMKRILTLLISFFSLFASPQTTNSNIHSDDPANLQKGIRISPRPELLSGGLIDIAQNGEMNASARVFRLFIGEPGKLQMPVSIYTGVSADNFSNPGFDDDIFLTLIDPATGIFNMSTEGNAALIGKRRKLTSFQVQYQTGLRFINIYNRYRYANTSFFNFISLAGFSFVTGAWEKNSMENTGIFWLSLRGIYSKSPSVSINEFFTEKVDSDIFGYAAGLGIEISRTIDVKMFYFRFINNRSVASFNRPYVQLSLNYSTR